MSKRFGLKPIVMQMRSYCLLALAWVFLALIPSISSAQSPDGVQDTDFPVGYWAADFYQNTNGMTGSPYGPSSGGAIWQGEAFFGVGDLGPVRLESNGSAANNRWANSETPTDPLLPPGYVGSVWSDTNPRYDVEWRRTIRFNGVLRLGYDSDANFDDNFEVIVNGVRQYAYWPGGSGATAPPNRRIIGPGLSSSSAFIPGFEIPVSAGDQVLFVFQNQGFIGGYEMSFQEVPEDPSITKVLTSNADEDGSGSVTEGDTLTFTITSTNNASASLTDFTVSDPDLTPASITCPTVAVGGTCVLTGTYVVTATDVSDTQITNIASVTSPEFQTVEEPTRSFSDTIIVPTFAVPPVAEDDTSPNNTAGDTVSLDVTDNDTSSGGTIDAATVSLITPFGATNVQTDADGDVIGFTVPGEGTWSVNETTGEVTFAPIVGYNSDPTPVNYIVDDSQGLSSDEATITIGYAVEPRHTFVCGPNTARASWPTTTVTNGGPSISTTTDTAGGNIVQTTLSNYSATAAGSELQLTSDSIRMVDNPPYPGHSVRLSTFTDQVVRIGYDGNNTSGDGGQVSAANQFDVITYTATSSSPVTWTVVGASNVDYTISGNSITVRGSSNAGQSGSRPFMGYTIETTGAVSSVDVVHDTTPNAVLGGINSMRFAACVASNVPPAANDDISTGNAAGSAVSVDITDNDTDSDGTIDETTVSLVVPSGATGVVTDADGDVIGFTVDGEGIWSVDETTGAVTFTPSPLYTGDPTPIRYKVDDDDGAPSNEATITIEYVRVPDQNIDTSLGNACTAIGGILVGSNIFTNADSGSFGFGSGAADEIPSTDPYPGQVSGGNFVNTFSGFSHGDYTYISNHQNRRNGGQYNGTYHDPVNGVTGRFMIVDPNADAPTMEFTASGVVPGTGYEVSFWVADSEFGNGPKQRYGVFVDGVEIYNTGLIDGDGVTLTWNKYSTVYQHTGTATTLDFEVRALETGAGGRDVFFDEVQIRDCVLPEPSINVVKSIASIADTNGSGVTGDAGDTITYDFTVTNTGDTSLAAITIDDPVLGLTGAAVSPAAIAPDGVATLTGQPYTITAVDQGRGFTSNSATATGTPVETDASGDPVPGTPLLDSTGTALPDVDDVSDTGTEPDLDGSDTPVDVATDPETTDTDGTPGNEAEEPTVLNLPTPMGSLAIVKSITGFTDLNGSLSLDAGDSVTFGFTAENTGDTSLANVSVTDAGLAPITLTPNAGFDGDLAPGESATIASATYVLTASDVASGEIQNTATGSADPVATLPSGQPDPSTPLLDGSGDPLPPVTDVSDAGTEPSIDPTTGLPTPVGTPETTETTPVGGTPDGDPTNDPTSLSLAAPSVSIQKSVASYADTNGNGIMDAGDTVTYSFRVENTGNTDLIDVAVTDSLPTAVVSGSPISTLAENAVDTSVTATYVLQSTDVDAGGVQNTATATGTAVDGSGTPLGDPFNPGNPLTVSDTSDAGTDPDGNTVTNPDVTESPDLTNTTDSDPTNDPTVFKIVPSPSIEVVKFIGAVRDVNGNSVLDAGDEVDYTFTVTNTGNADLSGVTVTDAKVTVSGGPIDLAIGAADTSTFTATYQIAAADVAAGGVENTAIASGNAVDGSGNPINDPITGAQLVATDDSDTGSETLLDGSGDPIDAVDPELADTPGLTAGPDGDPTNDPTVLFIPNPAMTVVKSVATILDDNIAGGDGLFGGDGDTINYSFTITNTGNVDLQGITLTDPKATVTGGPLDLAIGAGDSLTFSATYIVTPADTALGYIENTASATGNAVDGTGAAINGPDGTPVTTDAISDAGTDPDADPVSDPLNTETPNGTGTTDTDPSNDPTVTSVPGNPAPRISVIKSVASVADTTGDGAIGEGDTVTFSFAVTNTGNVNLADVAITDATATVAGGPITLAVGATDTTSFTATHLITAAEAAAGAVENSAEATANAVNSAGDPLLDPDTGLQRTTSDTSDAGTNPDIDASGTPTSYPDPLGTETPDATGGTDTDPTNDPTVLFLPMPQMQVVKSVSSVADTNGNGFTDAGDTVSYAFAVTNTGNTDLADITITDALAGVVLAGNPIAALSQGATDTSVTATYVLTTADIDAGAVENTAQATGTAVDDMGTPLGDPTSPGDPLTVSDTSDAGTDPNGDPVVDPETTETPSSETPPNGIPGDDPTTFSISPAPAIELTKSLGSVNDVDGNGLIGEGDVLTYTFSVTNTGNIDLSDVSISDVLGPISGGPVDLAIGATDTTTFTLLYTLTAADVTAGFKENTATATGTAVDSTGTVVNDPITGNPLTALDDSDAGTQPELGAGGSIDPVVDPETTETPDGSGTTDGDPTNDPTVVALPNPEITVVKSVAQVLDDNVASGDGLFGGEGDTVNYQFTVTNTGNVDLVGITLTDTLAPVSGGPIDLAVGAGDTLTFTSTYTVTATDVANGFLENTASATGSAVNASGDPLLDLNGNPITTIDTSDAGTDPNGDAIADPETTETPDGTGTTDSDPTNDPTVTTIPANPQPEMSLIKSVASVTDDGDGMLGAGDTINFSFTVTNTGNVDLGDVTVTDALANVTGGPITLAVGATDTTTFTATHVITAAEAAAGAVENTADVTGGAVNSAGDPITDPTTGDQLTTSDTSDAGTEPEFDSTGLPQTIADPEGNETPDGTGTTDGDPTNDPTVLFIPSPSLSVIKSVATVPDTNSDGLFGGPGDVITYAFTVTNTGNVTLDNVVVTDATANISGGPLTLAAGASDSTSITATYTVTAADIATGYVENTATGFGDALDSNGDPLGNPSDPGTPITVTSVSDSGTNPNGTTVSDPEGTETPSGTGTTDGDPANDPTVTSVPANPEPEISLIKSVATVFDTDGDEVLGGEDDEVIYQFNVTNTGNVDLANVTVNDPMLGGAIGTIPLLALGTTETFTVSYIITEADQLAGQVENTATASGTAVNGSGTPLINPTTGQPFETQDTSDSGTDSSLNPVGDPETTETPSIGSPDGNPTNDPTLLTIPLAVPDTSISGTVFLDANQDSALNTGDTGLPSYIVQIVDANGDVVASTTTGPDGSYSMSGFAIGTHRIEFIDPTTNLVIGSIENLVFGRNTVLTNQNQPVLPAASATALVATKTTPIRNVLLGGVVPYTITIENTQAFPVDFDIVDQLPTGLAYLPDSALVDGVAVEPVVNGRTLTWPGQSVAIGGSIVVELVARVGPNAPVGELVNTASGVDGPTGTLLSNLATASVRRNVEAVFDCSHVIGKVFDDRNLDGYQNAPASRRGGISNQNSIFSGKLGAAPQEGAIEPGLPNVRLVTATGTIITTDEFGRYSVPCAELPRDMGSNFTLKLDTRSLPTGYRVTTENPRVMRLTAGIMAEMNFGAAIGRVIDIDLTAKAFTSGSDPVDALTVGVDQILQKIAQTPAILRISYFDAGENQDLIDDRLDKLEDHIQDRWRKIGDYRLIVERTVKLLQ